MSNDRNVYGFPCLDERGPSDNSVNWQALHSANRDAVSQAAFRAFMGNAQQNAYWQQHTTVVAPTRLERAQAIAAEVCARRFPVRKLAVPLPDA